MKTADLIKKAKDLGHKESGMTAPCLCEELMLMLPTGWDDKSCRLRKKLMKAFIAANVIKTLNEGV